MVGLSCLLRRRHASGGKHRRRLQLVRNRTDDLDAGDLFQLADLLDRQIRLAAHQPLGRKTLRNDLRPGVDICRNAETLDQLRKRLATRGIKLKVSKAADNLLAEEGYDPTFGARPLKRVIQQRIENSLAQRILSGDFAEGDTITIDVDKAKHDFTFKKSTGAAEKELVESA